MLSGHLPWELARWHSDVSLDASNLTSPPSWKDIQKDKPILVTDLDTPYGKNKSMLNKINARGFDINSGEEGFTPLDKK